MFFVVVLALLGACAAQDITYTGDAAADFASLVDGKYVHEVVDGQFGPDVGVPVQLGSVLSGWDIERVFVAWRRDADELVFGIDCFGVCGDADGDGDPSQTSAALDALGGEDVADLSRAESFTVVLDFDLDAEAALTAGDVPPFDFILGVPAGQPADASETPAPGELPLLECSRGAEGDNLLSIGSCFGLYEYQVTDQVAVARRYARPLERNGAAWPVRNENPSPTAAAPDLEWVIEEFAALKALAGVPLDNQPWSFHLQMFAGSFLDAGVGEDYLPSQTTVVAIDFPCLITDACGVCNGDGSTCADCAGTPAGSAVYDECDVCAGDSSSCIDCAGTPNGVAVVDDCGVCGGDGTSCFDCLGQPAGTARYDACDICDGDNSSCLDCAGAPNGAAVYDECDVCNGDGSTCCGGDGKECCVNYCDVPDAYWDFILLPVTLDDVIAKLHFTNEILAWMCDALPPYEVVGPASRDLHFGRMAEFNRIWLEECLEDYGEQAGALYAALVADNAMPAALDY